ncbi:MAG: TRAP transporter small permease [Pseudomonadota bacterium]
MGKIADRVAEAWALAGGVLLLGIMAVTSVNAGAFALDRVARLAGASVAGLPGYEDFVRLAIASAACMFLPLCQRRRGHVAVDLFADLLSPGLQRALDRAWLVATALLALFLCYWMVLGMLETRADNGLSRILGWQEWPFYLPGVLSLLLWAVIAALQAREAAPPDV